MLSPNASISSSALCSMGDAAFARPMSPSGMFLSYARMQFCMALPSKALAFPRRRPLWRLLPFSRQGPQPGNP